MKVLITGGSRGIGKACVERFTSEGHNVVFFYQNETEKADAVACKTGAKAIKTDIKNAESVELAVKEATTYLGGIDVLINNAGVSDIRLFTEITNESWDTILGTNLTGAFYVTRAVSKIMISQKLGRIINIGSMWGKTGASCEVHYSSSKAGLRGFTMALAKELGPSGITVNCIEPGVIETDMNACLDKETLKSLENETPLCRIGKPSDVASLSYFLASDEASFITGQVIGVDGGFAV